MAKGSTLPKSPLYKFIDLSDAFDIIGKHLFSTWTGDEINTAKGDAGYPKKRRILLILFRIIKNCDCLAYYKNELMQRVQINYMNAAFILGLPNLENSTISMGEKGKLKLTCEVDQQSLENYLNTKWPKNDNRGRTPIYNHPLVKKIARDFIKRSPKGTAQKVLISMICEKYENDTGKEPNPGSIRDIVVKMTEYKKKFGK